MLTPTNIHVNNTPGAARLVALVGRYALAR